MGHVVGRTPFDFLENILTRPRNMQLDQVCYFQNMILLENSNEVIWIPPRAFFDRMRYELLLLYRSISFTMRDLCTASNFECYERGGYNANEAECRQEYNTPTTFWLFLYYYVLLALINVESLVAYFLSGLLSLDPSKSNPIPNDFEKP